MAKETCIIVVDVQKEYGEWFSYGYLHKLFTYLGKAHKAGTEIISVMEPKRETSGEHNAYKDGYIPTFLTDISTHIGYKLFDQDVWRKLDDPAIFTIPAADDQSGPYLTYMTEVLDQIVLKSPDTVRFELVGGGFTKCVKLMQRMLEAYGFEVTRNNEMCYDIHFVNSNRHANIFDDAPPAYFPKKYRNDVQRIKFARVADPMFIHLVNALEQHNPTSETLCHA